MAKDALTYADLRASLKRKEFFPVYLLYGEEDYLASEASDLLVDAALTPDERVFNLDIVYGNEGDARDIASRASSFPMMAERRVVVVREMDKLQNKELLAGYLEQPSPSTCLILVSVKPDFRKKPYVSAKRHGKVIEFKPLYDNQIPPWIMERVKGEGKAMVPEAAELLASYIGNSLREVLSELEKLYVYVGEKKNIDTNDVADVVGISKEYNIFELQRAVGAKDTVRSPFIVDRMLESGENATMILVMLTRYFTALWKLHDMRRRGVSPNEQATEAGVHPFYLKEYMSALAQYTSHEIEDAFGTLARADEQLKSTGNDPKTIMLMALVQVLDNKLIGAPIRRTG
ncbi:MAG: DNA polymerase III subunit delta [Bacteroidota bacterium]